VATPSSSSPRTRTKSFSALSRFVKAQAGRFHEADQFSETLDQKNGVTARIFFLDLAGSRVLSANPDGSDLKTIFRRGKQRNADGPESFDTAAGHLYGPTWEISRRTTGSFSGPISWPERDDDRSEGGDVHSKQLQLRTKSKSSTGATARDAL